MKPASIRKPTGMSPTILVPGDHYRFSRTLDFYERVAEKIKGITMLADWLGVIVLCVATIVLLSMSDERMSLVGKWAILAIVFSLLGSLVLHIKNKWTLLIAVPFLFFFGVPLSEVVRHITFEVASSNMPYHAVGATFGALIVFFAAKVGMQLRLKATCPSKSRIDFIRRAYLPLFEGDTSDSAPSAIVGLFDSPQEYMSDPIRSGRYMLVIDAVLFAARWQLTKDVFLTVRHIHRTAECYKQRKNKFKGTRVLDRIDIVLSGKHGYKVSDLREALRNSGSRLDFAQVGDKIKISIRGKMKVPASDVNFMTNVYDGPLVKDTVKRVSSLIVEKRKVV